jgi:FKBP-type peptidyl-prolyl cis-trans isomerase 2
MTRARFHLRMATSDGHLIESTYDAEPLDIELDTGAVHPCIERLVRVLPVGGSVTRRLCPEDAFGVPEADRCVTLARADFDAALSVEPGTIVEFDADGESVAGTIVAADAQSVTVDMNHPLAGRALDVRIELLDLAP